MSLWAIIPVKPLRRSKSRLSEVLSENERTQLNAQMLENTLNVLRSVSEIKEILVISRDTSALALGRSFGAKTLQEDGEAGLNLALKRAVLVAKAYSAQSILIMPMDIPFLSKEDIISLINNFHSSPGLVIAPDRHMNGTNAMLVSPPELIEFSFGPGSFERHIWQAQKKEARIEVVQMGSTGFDLDDPADLALYKKMQTYDNNFSEDKTMEDKHV
ncbi:MAG: 2-phospho-L-lactate guanylyltransferase [Anaerolineaceae bacterium]|nr:2-phospho-L-lactate guanylyltransferase [Anaerolineaceae bacterium]